MTGTTNVERRVERRVAMYSLLRKVVIVEVLSLRNAVGGGVVSLPSLLYLTVTMENGLGKVSLMRERSRRAKPKKTRSLFCLPMEERPRDISSMELDWTRRGRVDTSDDEMYRSLYHSSVQTCSDLQEQLHNYSGLLPKYRKISELKVSPLNKCWLTFL